MKRKMMLLASALASMTMPGIAPAQVKRQGEVVNAPAVVQITLPDGRVITPQATVLIDQRGDVVTPREAFQLVNANTPSAAATVYGGDYILAQSCTGYGTLTLQVRGPDGTTWLPLVTKTASDASSGTGLALGSYAVVRVSVSGTAGCFANLSRVPS